LGQLAVALRLVSDALSKRLASHERDSAASAPPSLLGVLGSTEQGVTEALGCASFSSLGYGSFVQFLERHHLSARLMRGLVPGPSTPSEVGDVADVKGAAVSVSTGSPNAGLADFIRQTVRVLTSSNARPTSTSAGAVAAVSGDVLSRLRVLLRSEFVRTSDLSDRAVEQWVASELRCPGFTLAEIVQSLEGAASTPSLLYASALAAGSWSPTPGSAESVSEAASHALLSAPYLLDLAIATHWPSRFASALGPLPTYLEMCARDPKSVLSSKQGFVAVKCDGQKLVRVFASDHPKATVDACCDALMSGDGAEAALRLTSVLVKSPHLFQSSVTSGVSGPMHRSIQMALRNAQLTLSAAQSSDSSFAGIEQLPALPVVMSFLAAVPTPLLAPLAPVLVVAFRK
jgi:hypothetical protein